MQTAVVNYVKTCPRNSLYHQLLIKIFGEKEIYHYVRIMLLKKYPYKGFVSFMNSTVKGYKNLTVYKTNTEGLITVLADIEMENGQIVTDMIDVHITDVVKEMLHSKIK